MALWVHTSDECHTPPGKKGSVSLGRLESCHAQPQVNWLAHPGEELIGTNTFCSQNARLLRCIFPHKSNAGQSLPTPADLLSFLLPSRLHVQRVRIFLFHQGKRNAACGDTLWVCVQSIRRQCGIGERMQGYGCIHVYGYAQFCGSYFLYQRGSEGIFLQLC